MNAPSLQKQGLLFGCTADQIRRQYAANAAQLLSMAEQAKRSGKKVNHYTEAELRAKAEEYRLRSIP